MQKLTPFFAGCLKTKFSLAESIVDSFNFYFDHCFGFYDNIERWIKSEEGYELFADIVKVQ